MKEQSALTVEQKAANFKTALHILTLRGLIDIVVTELLRRGREHDVTKMYSPEVEFFAKAVPVEGLDYTKENYQKSKEFLKTALDHHYAHSRHHTEHFKNGVNDMNLVDIFEMFLDWKSSSMMQDNGNLRKTIEENCKHYHIDAQLARILENTIDLVDQGVSV